MTTAELRTKLNNRDLVSVLCHDGSTMYLTNKEARDMSIECLISHYDSSCGVGMGVYQYKEN